MRFILNYVNDPEKTRPDLQGGVFVSRPENAFDEFMLNKQMWGRTDGRMCIHLVQSFAPGESTPEEVKQIAEEFLKHPQFKGFQISYAVHTDADHLHTHFVINTVNVMDGHKWQMTKQQLEDLKDFSDTLCMQHGLSVIRAKQKKPAQEKAEQNGRGWKKETRMAVDEALKIAYNRKDFIKIMELQGYKVQWRDERKYILFTNKDGKKMRNRLFDPPENYTKESMEKRFEENKKKLEEKQSRDRDAGKTEHDMQSYRENVLYFLSSLMSKSRSPYPHQEYLSCHSERAVEEYLKEMEKGEGLDWEQ